MKKKQILVVEDEGLIAKDIQGMLKRLGYDVPVTVGTGDLAIQTAEANKPDLILMDINLKGKIDGVEAAAIIKSRQQIPIVYLTANSDEPTFQRAKVTDPFGFMIKPFEERTLHAGIEMALYKHNSEKSAGEREQWLSTTLRSIADGIITTDERGHVTFLNDVAERITGWMLADAKGLHYLEIFSLLDGATLKVAMDFVSGALLEGRSQSSMTRTLLVTRNGGEIQIEHSTAPIRYGGDRIAGCVIVFRDVSAHQKLEDELRQTQKMDAIGKLAGSIAHDFNNAITAVMGYSSLMIARLESSDPLREDARQILRAAEYSARLTRQLLAFSRKQILHPVPLNLGEALQEMRGLLRRLIREDISLSIATEDGLWNIKADPGHVEQLVLNMAINARDAMEGNGTLSITVHNVSLSAKEAAGIHGGRAGEFVLLELADTGKGMPPEVVERIFEPFFTTKGPDKGTGLGLSTCESIVKNISGFIGVASTPGAGTTFSIYLQRSEEGRVSEELSATDLTPVHGGSQTILLVEDEEAVRMVAARVLEDAGYTVVEAENGLDALALLSHKTVGVDLIITDMVMPQMSGRELLGRVQSTGREVKVLVMSGYTDDEVLRDAVFESNIDFLQKPFTPDVLLRKVAAVMEGKGH